MSFNDIHRFGNGFSFFFPSWLHNINFRTYSKWMAQYPFIIDVISYNVIYFQLRNFCNIFLHSGDAIYYGLIQSNWSSNFVWHFHSRKPIKVNLYFSRAKESPASTLIIAFCLYFLSSCQFTERYIKKRSVYKSLIRKKSQTNKKNYLPHGQTY